MNSDSAMMTYYAGRFKYSVGANMLVAVRKLGLLCSLPVVVCLSGCSEYDASVNGVVSMDGSPLDHGKVTYISEGGAVIATGPIDSAGEYWVQVATAGGLPSGEYQVKVTCRAPAIPSKGGGPPAPGKSLIPRRYTRGHTSGWLFTVEPGSNTIDLEISSVK